ncbi:LIC_11090 family protein [Leptospira ognonensis]|uniref:LIC_11090 family protein n=1 Tax=Leptospira ognonensis TaxID=2484945 RepID=UPI001AEFB84E|nr:hypothetical protein [Leptospira ognonensis]
MHFRRSFSAGLLVILLSQAIFLGGGLLGACAEAASKICHCNHGSKKEIHANTEDGLFKTHQKIKKTMSLASDQSLLKENCHSAEPNVAHTCSCKKKKSSLARLSIYYQAWISNFSQSTFAFILSFQFSIPSSMICIQDEWGRKLLKPPRFT